MSEAGLHLFRFDTRDFPGAERVTVDAGECGAVNYSVIPAVRDGVRLAWRSSAGSIEHYTFPVVRTMTVRAERREAEGPVWIAEGDVYTPGCVVTDEAVVRRHGTLCCLEIAIRPKCKSRVSWN